MLSVIIPVFNEKNTILKIIEKIENLKNIDKEIIIVDDFSNDSTKEILKIYLTQITKFSFMKKT